MKPSAFKLKAFGLSDIGHIRKNNEDVFLAQKEYGFFALADGMGGHKAGEIAASEAVRFVASSIEELFVETEKVHSIFDLSSFNKLCIENANLWVHHLGRKKREYHGMGTTLCTLLFHDRSLIYGHVGDSRIYRFREGLLEQLTTDHSLLAEMLAKGEIVKESLQNFPHKNILTRAIGTQKEVEAEIHVAPVIENDLYLMCSDGLTDQVPDQTIKEILTETKDIQKGAASLVEEAKKRGGHDNITVLLIRSENEANLSR